MSIATPALTNFTAGEISPRLAGRVDLSKYFNGCMQLENFHVHPHGGATRRSGLRYVGEPVSHEGRSLLIGFEFNTEQTYVLEFGERDGAGFMRVYKDQAAVMSGDTIYEVPSPYLRDDFDDMYWTQSNDTLIIAHRNHAPRSITRSAHDSWSIQAITFTSQPSQWTTDNWPSCVCYYESRLVFAATPSQPNTLWLSRTGTFYDFTQNTNPETNGDPMDDDSIEVTIAASQANAIEFLVPRSRLFVGTTGGEWTVTGSGGGPIAPASVMAAPESTFGSSRAMPVQVGSGALYIQRAGKKLREMAYTFESDSFASVDLTILAEHITGDGITQCAYTQEPDSVVYSVRSDGLLLAFTYQRDQEVMAWGRMPTDGAVESITSVHNAARQRDELWACVRRSAPRSGYDLSVGDDLTAPMQGADGQSLTLPPGRTFESGCIVLAARPDGSSRYFQYTGSQAIAAPAEAPLSVVFADGPDSVQLEPIRTSTGETGASWTELDEGGHWQDVRCIEFLEAEFSGPATSPAFFLDSGLSYDGAPTSILSGLAHLAGRTVEVLADGATHPSVEVAPDGSITLARPASIIHAGLPFTSILKPMRIESGSGRGTAQTKKKLITEVAVRFYNTMGGRIGPDPDRLETVYYRSSATPMDQPAQAWSGDKSVKFPQGWNKDGALTIIQDQPLPMTVLMLVPTVVINE